MYSYEIEQLLKQKNYLLMAREYMNILYTSPQIKQLHYDKENDLFELWTDDNFYFSFKVHPDLKEEKGKTL